MVVATRFLLLYVLLALPVIMSSDRAFAQQSGVSINPIQGPPGTKVTGTGANWRPGDHMQVSWEDTGSILANTIVSTNGTFSVPFNVPSNAAEGRRNILFTALESRYFLVATFTVTRASARADLIPTAILYNSANLVRGRNVFFDSGVRNAGDQGTGVFNIRWFVDGVSVGYGSHSGVPARATVLNGNSQYTWVAKAGTHTIRFAVDVDNHVLESNESNNNIAVTVHVP